MPTAADRNLLLPPPTLASPAPTPAPRSAMAADGRLGRYWLALAITAGLLVTAVVGSTLYETPYYAFKPGNAFDTAPLVQVGGERATFAPEGDIFFLTVRLSPARLFEGFSGWVDRDIDLVAEQGVLGDLTEDENRAAQAQAMVDSERDAIVVALDTLGIARTPSGSGAIVVSVVPGSPADGMLEVSDVIIGVDGQPVGTDDDLGAFIGARVPGDVAVIDVEAIDGTRRQVAVTLAPREDEPARGFLGVGSDIRDFDPGAPFPIAIPTQGVGGPSAGLAFSLAIIDVLTEGELTGGRRVAVTGAIRRDGVVQLVGGVAQKSAAADAVGAEVLIVPLGEEEEARRLGYDVEVIGVGTIDEALAALEQIGGDPLPAPPST